jgi:hypothetical protein
LEESANVSTVCISNVKRHQVVGVRKVSNIAEQIKISVSKLHQNKAKECENKLPKVSRDSNADLMVKTVPELCIPPSRQLASDKYSIDGSHLSLVGEGVRKDANTAANIQDSVLRSSQNNKEGCSIELTSRPSVLVQDLSVKSPSELCLPLASQTASDINNHGSNDGHFVLSKQGKQRVVKYAIETVLNTQGSDQINQSKLVKELTSASSLSDLASHKTLSVNDSPHENLIVNHSPPIIQRHQFDNPPINLSGNTQFDNPLIQYFDNFKGYPKVPHNFDNPPIQNFDNFDRSPKIPHNSDSLSEIDSLSRQNPDNIENPPKLPHKSVSLEKVNTKPKVKDAAKWSQVFQGQSQSVNQLHRGESESDQDIVGSQQVNEKDSTHDRNIDHL